MEDSQESDYYEQLQLNGSATSQVSYKSLSSLVKGELFRGAVNSSPKTVRHNLTLEQTSSHDVLHPLLGLINVKDSGLIRLQFWPHNLQPATAEALLLLLLL